MPSLQRIVRKRLGEMLVNEGVLAPDRLKEGLELQEKTKQPLGEALIRLGYITETQIAEVLCKQYAKPFIRPAQYELNKELFELIPPQLLIRSVFLPLDRFDNLLVIAMGGSLSNELIRQLQELTGCDVDLFVSTPSDVKQILRRRYPRAYDPSTLEPKPEALEEMDSKFPITQAISMAKERLFTDMPTDEVPTILSEETAAITGRSQAQGVRSNQDADDMGEITHRLKPNAKEKKAKGDWQSVFDEGDQRVKSTLPEE